MKRVRSVVLTNNGTGLKASKRLKKEIPPVAPTQDGKYHNTVSSVTHVPGSFGEKASPSRTYESVTKRDVMSSLLMVLYLVGAWSLTFQPEEHTTKKRTPLLLGDKQETNEMPGGVYSTNLESHSLTKTPLERMAIVLRRPPQLRPSVSGPVEDRRS